MHYERDLHPAPLRRYLAQVPPEERPRAEAGGEFSGYRQFDGVRVPACGAIEGLTA